MTEIEWQHDSLQRSIGMARICFFRLGATPLFLADSRGVFGGAEVRAYTFAKALVERRHHGVSFAVRQAPSLPERSAEGIIIHPMPDRKRGVAKLIGSLRRRLTQSPSPYTALQGNDFDVIACFGIHDPTAGVVNVARRSGCCSLLFLTSSEDVDLDARPLGQRARHHANHSYAIMNADQIVVQTEFQRDKLRHHFGREGVLIRNPIDLQPVHELDQPNTHVLWVGRADVDSKRADVCFRIARQCPDVPFRVVIHGGAPALLDRLLAERPPNVVVHQQVPFHEIESLFATASVLINTSVSEGFPNAFLQAAKYKTPILSLGVDPDGVLSARDCGEVAGDESRLVQLIPEYHRRSARAVAQGESALRYVRDFHDAIDRARELDQLIQNAVRQKRAA